MNKNKCVICDNDILNDSQYINGRYYHNNCIEQLQQENKQLNKENKQLKSIIKTLIKEYDLEPTEYVKNLLKGDSNESTQSN